MMQIADLHGDFAAIRHRWPEARAAYRRALHLARELRQTRFVRLLRNKLAGAAREHGRG
jgi:predicted RNA polymerase sigma factor